MATEGRGAGRGAGSTGDTARSDYPYRSLNEFGTEVSVHRCSTCGETYTLCPPADEATWGTGCLAETCASYDPNRDVDLFFEPAVEAGIIRREPV